MKTITRGTIVSFNSAAYTATVLLDGSLAEVEMPVGEWVPKSLLAADDQVAVLLFQATNYENGVILGPFGAASGLLALTGTPTNGQVPIGRTSDGALVLAALTGTANRVTVTNGAGAITLSGPQDVHAGASPTFAGLNLTGQIEQSTLIGAHAYHSANVALSHNTLTIHALNSERWDTDGLHDTASNNSRLTCVTPGKYLIVAGVEFASNATGRRICSLKLNGATYLGVTQVGANPGNVTQLQTAAIYDLAATDYVEMEVFQNSGGALNSVAGSPHAPFLSMVRIP